MTDYVNDTSEENGQIRHVAKGWSEKIKEINRKYSNPRLKMTPLVRFSLFALRLYLIMLVIILV